MALGKQYEALSATPPAAASGLVSSQRKALRELEANRPGSGRRY
jgi:hypothetical protein